MNTTKAVIFGIIGLVLVVVMGGCTSLIGQRGTATRAENGIIAQRQACAQTVDASYNKIVATVNLGNQFYDQMKGIFESLADGEGTADGFMAILQTNAIASGTDWTAVQLEVIRVVNAELTIIANCQMTMADRLRAYADVLGRPIGVAAGQDGTFPNAWFADLNNLPRRLAAGADTSPKSDLDGDGVLTVFDFPAVVVSGLTADAYDDGYLPTLDIVATATPQP